MGYSLKEHETISEAVQRIALEQIDDALETMGNPEIDQDDRIHESRKDFKRIRGLLRLVRDEIGDEVYKRENACYRDAGHKFAGLRDSAVMIKIVDKLRDKFEDGVATGVFEHLRAHLVNRHKGLSQYLDEQNVIEQVHQAIEKARERVEQWPIEHDDFRALEDGLHRVYKRGRKRFEDAYDDPAPAHFHEWRKRAKYLRYHLDILQPLWPDVLDATEDTLHDLTDYLGEANDYAVLSQLLLSHPQLVTRDADRQILEALLQQQREACYAMARPIGMRVYVEKPEQFVDRIAAYWESWQRAIRHEQDPISTV
ncbi:MAG: CHAD domain-containing protein [Anaerolineae bacterium]|nr:CHAD domain-containing protein [Anaerolineae bacterium]